MPLRGALRTALTGLLMTGAACAQATGSCVMPPVGTPNPSGCPASAPASNVYGYTASFFKAAQPDNLYCANVRFKTLEAAEAAIRNDPCAPSQASAELAFPAIDPSELLTWPLSAQTTAQSHPFLDYRPAGSLSAGTVFQPPAEVETVQGYAINASSWPPSAPAPGCSAANNACTIHHFCSTAEIERQRVQCQATATYPGVMDSVTLVGSSLTSPLKVSTDHPVTDVTGNGRASGNYWQGPTSPSSYTSSGQYVMLKWHTVGSLLAGGDGTSSAARGTSSPPIAEGRDAALSTADGAAKFGGAVTADTKYSSAFPMEKRQWFWCNKGLTVNTSATPGSGQECQASAFKVGVVPPTIQQTDQCGVGDPCIPGNGNAVVTERGFRYGFIDFDLHYNSLRQLRPYSFIDRNWSHSFASRVLTSSLTGGHTTPGMAILVQSAQAHLEAYYYVGGNVFRSTNKIGNVLWKESKWGGNWDLYRPDGQIDVFDVDGRLIKTGSLDNPAAMLSISYVSSNVSDDGYWRVAKVADGNGRFITFEYDTSPFRWLTSIKSDLATELMHFNYEEPLHRLSRVDQFGTSRTYLYNEQSHTANTDLPYHLTGILDELGRRWGTWEYDDWGRATANWHGSANAEKVTLSYPSDDSVNVTLPKGDIQVYRFTTDQPFRKIDAFADGRGSMTTTYDSAHRPLQTADRRNVVTAREYSGSGLHETARIEAQGTAEERRIETDWDDSLNRVLERRTYGKAVPPATGYVLESKTRYTYNARGQLLTHSEVPTSGAARTWTYTYCESADVGAPGSPCPYVGLLKRVSDPRNYASNYAYYTTDAGDGTYKKGDLASVTNALSQATLFVRYDAAGRLARSKDPNGTYTDLTYTSRGWLQTRSVRDNADGTPSATADATTRMDYDNVGNLIKITRPDATFLSFAYDDANRQTDIYDAVNDHIHYTVDVEGNRTKEDTYDPSNTLRHTLSRTYNSLNQLQASIDAYSHTGTYTYDGNGNNIGQVAPRGPKTQTVFDALNRVISVVRNKDGTSVNTGNTTSSYGYDARDHLRKVTDPDGLVTTYDYDDLGNLTALHSPDTGTTTYTYDATGNRLSSTDARGVVTQNTYDALNRPGSTTFPSDPSLNMTFSYEGPNPNCTNNDGFLVGRLRKVVEATDVVNYCYDRRGNVTQKMEGLYTGGNMIVRYTYDLADNLRSMTYPSGATITYGRDAAGRITSATYMDASGFPFVFAHDAAYYPFGPLKSVVNGSNQTTTRTYDLNYWVASLGSTVTGGINEAYTYDADGNLATVNGAGTQYGYDALERLVSATNGHTSQTFGYSRTGDLTTRSDVLVAAQPGDDPNWTQNHQFLYAPGTHRLTSDSVGPVNRTVDAMGNTTSIGTTQFTFDARGRMATATTPLGAAWTYGLNYGGQRVAKTAPVGQGSESRRYVYDEAGILLGEYDTSKNRVMEYYYFDEKPYAAMTPSNGYYIQTDMLGTPRRLWDVAASKFVWSWDSSGSPFGQIPPNEDFDNDGVPTSFNLRFPGQYYDSESGISYNYFRDYDSTTGRYVESDPIGLRGGMNSYRYAGANPILFTDHFGLDYWVEGADDSGEPAFHQSVCVGKYGTQNRYCISFGAIEQSPTCSVLCQGEVYQDDGPPGPVIFGRYRTSSAAVDTQIAHLFDQLIGQPGLYNVFILNCRTFSDKVFYAIDRAFGGGGVSTNGGPIQ